MYFLLRLSHHSRRRSMGMRMVLPLPFQVDFFQNPHHVLGAGTGRRGLERRNGQVVEKALTARRVVDQVGLLRFPRRDAGLHQCRRHGAVGVAALEEDAEGLAASLLRRVAAQLHPGGIDVHDAVRCRGSGHDEGAMLPVLPRVVVLQCLLQRVGQSHLLLLLLCWCCCCFCCCVVIVGCSSRSCSCC